MTSKSLESTKKLIFFQDIYIFKIYLNATENTIQYNTENKLTFHPLSFISIISYNICQHCMLVSIYDLNLTRKYFNFLNLLLD
jgi:hypothetical protein